MRISLAKTRAAAVAVAVGLVCSAPLAAEGARGVFGQPKDAKKGAAMGGEQQIRDVTPRRDSPAPGRGVAPAEPRKPPSGGAVSPHGEATGPAAGVIEPADEAIESLTPVDQAPGDGPSGPSPVPARPFAAGSFWNKPLPDNAPLDRLSTTYVADLQRQVAEWGPYINTTKWGIPVYTVPRDQPTVRVALPNPNWSRARLQAAWEEVPLPATARPSPDNDHRLVLWQPSTDTMWEFFELRREPDGWHSTWGGRMLSVSKNIGTYTDPPGWGASATGIPLLGGLMRIEEMQSLRIDHGLALTIPEARARVYSWPAARTDGLVDSPTAIPGGTRFRLDPKVDVDALPVAPLVREMARAVQRYGLVVRDRGGAVAFYAEDPAQLGFDPYRSPGGGIFGRWTASQLARQFPWQHLQALQTDLHTER